MWLRLVIVLLGIVVMVNGCNGLISQNFGTHKLRKISLEAVIADGLGDADYVEVKNAVLIEDYLVGPAIRASDMDYHLHPILTTEEAAKLTASQTATATMVGWYMIPYADCVKNGDCSVKGAALRGLVTAPTVKKNPKEKWAEKNIQLTDDVIYLQLWKAPLAWYWNALLFFGGIGLSIGVEAWWQSRNKRV